MARRAILSGGLVVGIAAIAFAATTHYFMRGSCLATQERHQQAPDGFGNIILGKTSCASGTEVSVKLIDSGKTYLLFLGSSPLTDPEIELRWNSSSILELHYPAEMQVRIPPETTRVRNFFGQTEVVYRAGGDRAFNR